MGDNRKLKRFVTYIYEYERGIRGRNVGFIRTDIRDTCCRMEIHIRGLDRFKGKCTVYLVVPGNDTAGIPAAEIMLAQGTGVLKLNFPQNRIGNSGYPVSDLQAVVIRYGSGKVLAGCFVNKPSEKILRGDFTIWKSGTGKLSETTEKTTAASTTETTPEVHTQAAAEAVTEPAPEVHTQTAAESVTEPAPEVHTQTAAESVTEPAPEVQSKAEADSATDPGTESVSDIPAHENDQQAQSLAGPKSVSYQRIEITDIRNLPRNNWHLCNNSFLVHGFFNYHYLVMKTVENEEETQRFIGVPGIYEQPERMMALLFGFPEFEAATEDATGRPHPENANGTFGYWLCQVGI